ncbi:MAG: Rv3654c family TadE-like protein, partial [Geodermatophilaceae bacterium]
MTGRRSPGYERGSAGVWLLGLCTVLALVATAAVLVGSAMVLRHRAAAAADLSALAAAGDVLAGETAACGRASTVAEA